MIKKVLTVCLWMAVIAAVNIALAENPSQSGAPSSSSMRTGSQHLSSGQSAMTQLEPLVGRTILDAQQKEIGRIQDIVLDSQSQKARYAILGSGGFLGVGENYRAVPWSALNIHMSQDTIQSVSIRTDADTIKNSPIVQLGATRSFDSRLQSQVDSYYQGKGIQTNGMMDGMQSVPSNGTSAQPESGDSFQPRSQTDGSIGSSDSGTDYQSPAGGSRPSGMTGTTNQNRQLNTAQPQRDSIYQETDGTNGTYGDGIRDGQDQDVSSDPNKMSQTSPFGTSSNGTSYTDGTTSDEISSGSSATGAKFRKGYAEGYDRIQTPPSDSGVTSQDGMTDGQSMQAAGSQFLFFTDLSDREVKGTNDEKIGALKDLVVDSRQGNIAFGLVSMDDGMVAVPWNALQMRGQDALVVSVDKESLRTLAFKSDNKPNFNDPSYQQRVYRQFGQQPPSVYGYVSPGAAAMDLESDYTRQFDSSKLETLSGEIQEVMNDPMQQQKLSQSQGQGQRSMTPQVSQHLKIRTDQGQTLDIHAAPEQFLKQRNLELKKGDRIQVTGSRVQMQGKDVLIASRISKDGQEVMLRSAQGQPLWSPSVRSGTSGSPTTGDGMTDSQTNGSSALSGQSMQFKSQDQTSISGTIQSTDTGSAGAAGAMSAMNEAVLFKVQTDQGQTQTIYAGPRHYLQQENMTFSTGDKVTATGWKKTIGGQEVFIASKIEKDGQTLQLRDSQGIPQWKQEGSSSNGMDSQQKSTDGSRSGTSTLTY